MFLMYRMELKAFKDADCVDIHAFVPNVPYGVESQRCGLCLKKRIGVPNVPYGVESILGEIPTARVSRQVPNVPYGVERYAGRKSVGSWKGS